MGPSETTECFPYLWVILKRAKATFGNRREITTLEFAWIPEFIGARDVFIFGELNVCHREKVQHWSHFKFCQRISWESKSKSLCEMKVKSIIYRDDPGEAGESEESMNMPFREKGSLSDPPGSEILKPAYSRTHH